MDFRLSHLMHSVTSETTIQKQMPLIAKISVYSPQQLRVQMSLKNIIVKSKKKRYLLKDRVHL